MDVGFSLIKRDYIFASDCNYDDTTNLQIRCPFCFEPLFLKSGSTKKDHFSHYAESLNSADCELRAKSYYSSYSEFEAETKGQTLLKHYRMFSNLYAIYLGIPKDLILFSDSQYNEIIKPVIELVKQGKSELELELQRDNMKDFLNLSLKSLFNAIIILNLEIPEYIIFYDLYKKSVQDFLDLINKRIFDYNNQGSDLLKKSLKTNNNTEPVEYSQQLLEQIVQNYEYVINTLAKRFSTAEIRIMLFGGIIKKNTDIHNYIQKLKQSIEKKFTGSYMTITGKMQPCMYPNVSKYTTEVDCHKMSLFLGQENVIFYRTLNHKKNIKEYRIHLIKPNINFFERLARISSFSKSQKSLFYEYYKWGPISNREYPIFNQEITTEDTKIYLGIYSTEEQKFKRKAEEKNKEKTEIIKQSPTFIVHKRDEKQPIETTICRICKKEIPTFRLRAHLKAEHPKRK